MDVWFIQTSLEAPSRRARARDCRQSPRHARQRDGNRFPINTPTRSPTLGRCAATTRLASANTERAPLDLLGAKHKNVPGSIMVFRPAPDTTRALSPISLSSWHEELDEVANIAPVARCVVVHIGAGNLAGWKGNGVAHRVE